MMRARLLALALLAMSNTALGDPLIPQNQGVFPMPSSAPFNAAAAGVVTGSCATSNAIAYFSTSSTLTCNASLTTDGSGRIRTAAGTAALPAFSFTSDTNTGIYSDTANEIKFSANGGERGRINVNGFGAANGSVALPSLFFINDTLNDTGIYRSAENTVAITAGGGGGLFTFTTTSLTSTEPFLGPVGSATAPVYSFSTDTNTGLYFVGADDLGITVGGTLRWDISTSAVTSVLPLQGQAGSTVAPTYSFSGDSDTGVYNVSPNVLGFSAGNTLELAVTSTGVAFFGFLGGGAGANTPLVADQSYTYSVHGAGAPTATDCDAANEAGRTYIDTVAPAWYVCIGASGWQQVAVAP